MKSISIPRSLLISAACCVLALIVMTVCLVLRAQPPAFVPPAFDETAQQGVPEAPAELGWCEVFQAGMSFRASVCGVFRPEGSQADVYLYSAPENEVWLKLRALDSQGNTLGETGLIRPGEYVRSVQLHTLPQPGEAVTLKLMSYEPDTYHSMGAVTVQCQTN